MTNAAQHQGRSSAPARRSPDSVVDVACGLPTATASTRTSGAPRALGGECNHEANRKTKRMQPGGWGVSRRIETDDLPAWVASLLMRKNFVLAV
jgi:hypothetical protein